MFDFFTVGTRPKKNGVIEVYPRFLISEVSDLMIRGGDFYAVWLEDRGVWSTNEFDLFKRIDAILDKYVEEHKHTFEGSVSVRHFREAESGVVDDWHRYVQKQLRDQYTMLDEKIIFANDNVTKNDYSSKSLPYPLEDGACPGYDKLMSTLYTPEERHKLEWAVGSIVTGDSKWIQKFIVLYGSAGSGKSTFLNILQKLFEGYYSVFDAKSLGSSNNAFALEPFRCNPLVAIQHDGDLSHIEDNTRLNSLVSHEAMTVNEKFKSAYTNSFKAFLFMGTNKPVKITDAKSGLIRRLIDVTPSGNKLSSEEYWDCMDKIDFELGHIAAHCRDVYLSNPRAYDDYIPLDMMGATNDFYNFMEDSYFAFKDVEGISLKCAWERYKTWVEDAKIQYPFSQRVFKEELKNYFSEYYDRYTLPSGERVRSYYKGFLTSKFETQNQNPQNPAKEIRENNSWLIFDGISSIFDQECADCPAQYGIVDGANSRPTKKWDDVTTTLKDLDTSQLHFVRVPENHIVIDFDIKGPDGKKSFEKNLEAASKWPPTYAELSKSGEGIHLHYIYNGDVTKLSCIYDENIEVKVFTGKTSLRRKLTKFNSLPIAIISSGLPLKKGDKMVDFDGIKSEKGLRTIIKRNLAKEYHANTKPSVDFIYKALEDAYNSGLPYDVSDMRDAVLAFACQSHNQSDYCIKLVSKMHFKSQERDDTLGQTKDDPILVFFDCEVFPNLFLVNWKYAGENQPVVRMINPSPDDISVLAKMKLVGFNCRRYDNHILYARMMGYSNEELFDLSQRIVAGEQAFFSEAYNLSYTDIYDYCDKKQSLKKWEIELGIHHMELGLPWDKPVPEEQWIDVAEYCDNDVISTEAVFNATQGAFAARCILAELTGMSVNTPTNTLSARFIFGNEKHPQSVFNYRDMGDESQIDRDYIFDNNGVFYQGYGDEYTVFDSQQRPIFPGYKFENGVSTYRGEEVGEGGYVYAEPGMYSYVALLDIASMHPSSVIAEELFGPLYTKRFKDIRDARVHIKHADGYFKDDDIASGEAELDKAREMLDGALVPYLNDHSLLKPLAQALKIVINSIYGLTSAKFDNPFRDKRNVDNIVAKRGALFMVNLKHEVQKRGFTVAHIKTDSIKIPNATPDIIQFVMDYGKMYGYNFEHEATYERMCLVNDAVYIARYLNKDGTPGKWTATGTQFAVPYVFKTLFSHDPIEFDDMCETKSVTSSLYLDTNEDLPSVEAEEAELEKIMKATRKAGEVSPDQALRINELRDIIESGHNYRFVGKVGRFCPIKPGCHGGRLVRQCVDKDGNIKYASATGANGYRWLESEEVEILEKENDIDTSYYRHLVDDAVDTMSQYGDVSIFCSDTPLPVESKAPDVMPCGRSSCINCPDLHNDQHHLECRAGYELPALPF